MPKRPATDIQPLTRVGKTTLDQRIEELRTREPLDISRGQALLLQGIATSSLREQRLSGNKIDLS